MTTNKIIATLTKSKYSQLHHLSIKIDDMFLDQILGKTYPEDNFLGLVPTLLNWLNNGKERKIVWSKIVPNEKSSEIVPIMMCPDDCDFSCTTIVVEVFKKKNNIEWRRFGLDITKSELLPDQVGRTVKWLKDIPSYSFKSEEYLDFVSKFKKELEIN